MTMASEGTAPSAALGKVVLALPAFNEAKNLPSLVREAATVFGEAGIPWECVVVDDHSTDDTPEVLEQLKREFPLTTTRHDRNRGLGGAITTAIDMALTLATGADDVIVTMDADNTHSPSYVPAMAWRLWLEPLDLVIASRYCLGSREMGVPFGRLLLSRGARLMFKLFLRLHNVTDYTCGYRAFRASVLRQAKEKYGDRLIVRQGFACTDELLVKISLITKRISEVPFTLRYDLKQGKSKLPLMRTIYETLKLLIFKC